MDRFKDKPGGDLSLWVLDHHKVWKWVQDFIENNIKKWLVRWMVQPGVIYLGSSDDALKNTTTVKNGANIDLTVEAGAAITELGDMVILASQTVYPITWPGAPVTRYFYLKRVAVDDTDTTYDITRVPSSMADINVHEMDSFTAHLDAAWPSSGADDDIVRIAQIDIDGGEVITITDARVQTRPFFLNATAIDWINDNQGLTKDGTAETDFTVNGVSVLTESAIPEVPLDFRIWDINPDHNSKGGTCSKITFKWNFNGLLGQHEVPDGTDTIRIDLFVAGTDLEMDVAANELAGFKLYSLDFISGDNTYIIISNLATAGGETVITLESAYADETITVTNPGKVIDDADEIQIKRTLYVSGSEIVRSVKATHLDNVIVLEQRWEVLLPLGSSWVLRIRAKKGERYSAWATMAAGDYDPDHAAGGQAPVSYASPFLNSLPLLDEAGFPGSLTPITTPFGFTLQADGWDDGATEDGTLHMFEYIYTTQSTIVWTDYTNARHVFSASKSIDVVASSFATYQVGVRPLQNKQVVGTPVEDTVRSGTGGQLPQDQLLLDSRIAIYTFDGTIASYAAPWVTITDLTTINTPSGQTSTKVEDIAEILGYVNSTRAKQCILKDSAGEEFWIVSGKPGTSSEVKFKLKNISGDSSTPQTGVFEINTTKLGRRIGSADGLPVEYDLTKVFLHVKDIEGATVGSPAVVRIYQDAGGGESNADSITQYNDDSKKTGDINVKLQSSVGALNLAVDLFDVTGSPNNDASVYGRVKVYAIPTLTRDKLIAEVISAL